RAGSGAPQRNVAVRRVGANRSATRRSKADYPQPEGPRRLTKPPGATLRPTFSSAVTEPRSLVNRTVAFSRSTARAAPGLLMDLGGLADYAPILGRAAAVAFKTESVMTSVTFGAGALNCWSSS